MSFLDFVIMALAVWRLSVYISSERGPWAIMDRFRYWIGVRYSDGHAYGKNEIARLALCPWCAGVWVGLGVAVAYAVCPEGTVWACLPFALGAGSILVHVSRPIQHYIQSMRDQGHGS